jgi:hypothetical protein
MVHGAIPAISRQSWGERCLTVSSSYVGRIRPARIPYKYTSSWKNFAEISGLQNDFTIGINLGARQQKGFQDSTKETTKGTGSISRRRGGNFNSPQTNPFGA